MHSVIPSPNRIYYIRQRPIVERKERPMTVYPEAYTPFIDKTGESGNEI
jgi:hypothetical protein